MKNAVKVSMKVSIKMSRFLDISRENSVRWYNKKSILVYRKFRYFREQYDILILNRYFNIFDILKHHYSQHYPIQNTIPAIHIKNKRRNTSVHALCTV